MPMAPDKIGQDGETVRNVVQDVMNNIDQLMLDPIFVKNNNRASKADALAGKKIYVFEYPGQLNNSEISTMKSGWESEGWTSADAVNKGPSPHDHADYLVWVLTLIKEP